MAAVKHDQRTQSTSFFNSLVAAYTGWNDTRNRGEEAVILAETGEVLDPAFMRDCQRIMEEICVAIPWQKGDVMLLDNRTVMHSRRTFEGPRRILAALGRDPNR
ncbi:hypothetical protein EON65_26350 [archaeon]|nr:MAG: hypothetical protein EON65_26350 [archaeon]